MNSDKLAEKFREHPGRILLIVFVVVFWLLAPLLAQRYLNVSAIAVSFVVTLIYFISWKTAENLF